MLNFSIPGQTSQFMRLAQEGERKRVAEKALVDSRRECDGYKKELAEASEKIRVLEAKLTAMQSALLNALESRNLPSRFGATKDA